jgi:hypothetical protein
VRFFVSSFILYAITFPYLAQVDSDNQRICRNDFHWHAGELDSSLSHEQDDTPYHTHCRKGGDKINRNARDHKSQNHNDQKNHSSDSFVIRIDYLPLSIFPGVM